jgi:uncharacterized repeat protein (TIGR01451 family)
VPTTIRYTDKNPYHVSISLPFRSIRLSRKLKQRTRSFLTISAVLSLFLWQIPFSRAAFDDTAALRATTAIDPGGTIDIHVDDSQFAQTILIVDDDSTVTDIAPTMPQLRVPQLRFNLQALQNIGFPATLSGDCPGALSASVVNFWDTANCGSPSAALMGTADIIIWTTANALGTNTSDAEITDLTTFLTGGGSLFFQSHGYIFDNDTCGGPFPQTIEDTTPCFTTVQTDFIRTYLGVDQYTRTARGPADNRPLAYTGVSGDIIGGPGGAVINWKNRKLGGYLEGFVDTLTLTGSASPVMIEDDAAFGVSAPDNVIMSRTTNGTARTVFAPFFIENQKNTTDPDNFRTLFQRTISFLSDAPTVSVTNPRTGETETIALINSGIGVATGTVGTVAGSSAPGDLIVGVAAGDQLITSYDDTSPGPTVTITDTTSITVASPLSFTDATGTPLTTISVPGSFFLQVTDPDKNTSSAVQSFALTVTSSTGDSESITVTETTGTSNVFRSSAIPTALNDTTANNGTLGVADGATVSVTGYGYLGAEIRRVFTQSYWDGGTTDTVPTIPGSLSGFDERDSLVDINADEIGYFVHDDPGSLSTDWLKNDFPPNPNPILGPAFDAGGGVNFDAFGVTDPMVLREPSTGDYYLLYTGRDSSSGDELEGIGLAISTADTTAPAGRDFVKYPDDTTYAPLLDQVTAPADSWWECGAQEPTVVINPGLAFGATAGGHGHFEMYFRGTADSAVGKDCTALGGAPFVQSIGHAFSGDGITWTVDAAPSLTPGCVGAFDDDGVMEPSVIYDPSLLPADPWLMWYGGAPSSATATNIGFASDADGLGTWTKLPGGAPCTDDGGPVLPIGAATEWDEGGVSDPSVVFDPTFGGGTYVMYYEGAITACVSGIFSPAIGRAESVTPSGVFTRPAAPADAADPAACGNGGYENITLVAPLTFVDWEFVTAAPSLLLDPTDGIDRLYYNSPTELGPQVGMAWNYDSTTASNLYSNPLDTDTAGFTTTDFGALRVTRLGQRTTSLSARTSDTLADLQNTTYAAGAPTLVNGALLGDFDPLVDSAERFLQYRVEIAADETMPDINAYAAPDIFTDAVEEISLDVFQRPNLFQTLAVPVELTATDATVRITDVTFTQDPISQEVTYDLTSALDETQKIVVDENGGEVLPGDQLDYRIEVRNSASIPLTQVTVTDEIPLGTEYLAGSIFGTGATDSGLPTLQWNLGTLDPGELEVIGFSVIVRPDIGQGSEILNQAFINSYETGVIPSDNPVTPLRRDPTILPVGARLLFILIGTGALSLLIVAYRERRRVRKHMMLAAMALMLIICAPSLAPLVAQAQSPGNDMYFEIVDADQNVDPAIINTVQATLTTSPSGDSELLTLNETGIDTGIFRTSYRAVLDLLQNQNNGLLEVEPGDVITLSYVDQFNSTGQPITRTDSVTVIVDPLFVISVIALQPIVLPGGGQTTTVLAGPRDVFGRPAVDGTQVDFSASNGTLNPTSDDTSNGIAESTFSSGTIVNPTIIDASVARGNATDTGSVALTTNVSTTTTTTSAPVPLNQPPDITITGPSNGGTGLPTNTPGNNVPGEAIPDEEPVMPTDETAGPSLLDRIREFEARPVVAQIQNAIDRIINPFAIAFAALNLLLATTLAAWYPFLLRIFLEPAQVLFGRKRRPWGIIFNSLTKQPIDLAIVRLFDESKRLVSTKVTDRLGRYGFLVEPGRYTMTVIKPGFVYPTRILSGDSDNNYSNLHYGAEFLVKEPTFVNFNVPIDPPEARPTIQQALRRHFRLATHNFISFAGIVIGVLSLIAVHSRLSLILLILHVLVFFLFRRLARGRKHRQWGQVYDTVTGNSLGHSVVHIFDQKYNRLLETQVVDRLGRFGFLVGKAEYRMDAQKPGYVFPAAQKIRSNDYIGGTIAPTDVSAIVTTDIPLEPESIARKRVENLGVVTPQAPHRPVGPPKPPTVRPGGELTV